MPKSHKVAGLWCLIITGASLITASYYIELKATLSQMLIGHSWHQLQKGIHQPPWPWADTVAIAKLSMNNQSMFVLEGANARNLAFGPTRADRSAQLHENGTKIILGHRDTHFAHLASTKTNDIIEVETVTGEVKRYQVQSSLVVDTQNAQVLLHSNIDELLLITCFPFNGVSTDTQLRYVVSASLLLDK